MVSNLIMFIQARGTTWLVFMKYIDWLPLYQIEKNLEEIN